MFICNISGSPPCANVLQIVFQPRCVFIRPVYDVNAPLTLWETSLNATINIGFMLIVSVKILAFNQNSKRKELCYKSKSRRELYSANQNSNVSAAARYVMAIEQEWSLTIL
jgi:hypothetical protein